MKCFQDFVVALLMVTSAQAVGSGPYLPSGWRPEGPSFLLPGEINESPAVPLKVAQESLAAGSDSLREYGPPKLEEVSQDITQQALPDEAAAPPFFIIRTDFHEETKESEYNEATTEQETIDEKLFVTTEATVDVNTDIQSKIESKSIKFDSENVTDIAIRDVEFDSNVKETEQISDTKTDNDAVGKTEESYVTKSDDIKSVKETSNTMGQTEVAIQIKSDIVTSNDSNSATISQTKASEIESDDTESNSEAQVKLIDNVDENESKNKEFSQVNSEEFNKEEESERLNENEETTIANNEVLAAEQDKRERKDSAVNNIAEAIVSLEKDVKGQPDQDGEVKKIADIAGTGQPIPEGFLEYGPPGFKEYGPPAVSKVVEEPNSSGNEVGNDIRRRRYSPKFKSNSSKKH